MSQPTITVRELRRMLFNVEDQEALVRVVSAEDGANIDFPANDGTGDETIIATIGNVAIVA